jgi:hypothetical protein
MEVDEARQSPGRVLNQQPWPGVAVMLRVLIALALTLTVWLTPGNAQTVTWWLPTPAQRLTLHWVLGDRLDVTDPIQMGLRDFNGGVLPAPDVYDIDAEFNTAETVAYLHTLGKKVIGYIDVGVYEIYRTDAWKFQRLTPRIWGNKDGNWDGSYWLDVRRINDLAPIVKARLQMARDKGFDAIEPDEMDGWENNSGFPLTYQDQLNYNRAVASWAHELGLSIGQKGDIVQVQDLVGSFDWTLNEQCFQYKECTNPWNPVTGREQVGLQAYVQANKAVWVAEYRNYSTSRWKSICQTSGAQQWMTSRFRLGLPNDGGRLPCQ